MKHVRKHRNGILSLVSFFIPCLEKYSQLADQRPGLLLHVLRYITGNISLYFPVIFCAQQLCMLESFWRPPEKLFKYCERFRTVPITSANFPITSEHFRRFSENFKKSPKLLKSFEPFSKFSKIFWRFPSRLRRFPKIFQKFKNITKTLQKQDFQKSHKLLKNGFEAFRSFLKSAGDIRTSSKIPENIPKNRHGIKYLSMLSRGIPWNIQLVTCIFFVYTPA